MITGSNVPRALMGGFVATLVMTIVAYSAPVIGLPRMDFGAMLGSYVTGQQAEMMSSPWWAGTIIHFINGTLIFPLIYALLLYAWLPGTPIMKGLLWGLTLWALSQSIVTPMMGMGFFSSRAPEPALMVAGSLVGHIIYGSLLGALAGHQAVHIPMPHVERHA